MVSDAEFGFSVAKLGDVDGDNITELAIGTPNGDDGGEVLIMLLVTTGNLHSYTSLNGTVRFLFIPFHGTGSTGPSCRVSDLETAPDSETRSPHLEI